MSRFHSQLKALWLALKRQNVMKDLRKVIVECARRKMFAWETEQLRDERSSHPEYFSRWFGKEFLRFLRVSVEKCEPLPFPANEPFPLHLRRMKVAFHRHNLQNMWLWLE